MVSFLEHTQIPHIPGLRLPKALPPSAEKSSDSSTWLDLPASFPIALSWYCTPSHPKLLLFPQAMLLSHAVWVLLPSSLAPPTNPHFLGLPLALCLTGLAAIPSPLPPILAVLQGRCPRARGETDSERALFQAVQQGSD